MTEGQPEKTSARKHRRCYQGSVLSGPLDKTIKVQLEQITKHARYGKYISRRTKLLVHDERNEAREGDVVEIMETRPISKTKSWRLVRIVRSAAGSTEAR